MNEFSLSKAETIVLVFTGRWARGWESRHVRWGGRVRRVKRWVTNVGIRVVIKEGNVGEEVDIMVKWVEVGKQVGGYGWQS